METAVLTLDFATDSVGVWRGERRQRVREMAAGTIHAILASWEVCKAPPGRTPHAHTHASRPPPGRTLQATHPSCTETAHAAGL